MNLYVIAGLTLFALLLSSASRASESKISSQWSSKCLFKKSKVIFEAKSKSGDPYEDDMTAMLQINKKKMIVPIGTGLFMPIAPSKKLDICDKTVGIEVNENQFVILFATNDRPSLDLLTALLIDTTSGDILDLAKDIGSFFHSTHEKQIQIEKTETGFRSLMAQGWNKTSKTDSAQEVMMGWINVSLKDGKISAKWEKQLPSTHSLYSKPQ